MGKGVGNKGFFRRTIARRENLLMSVRNTLILDAIKGISRRFRFASRDPLYKSFSFVFHRTENEREREKRETKIPRRL